MSQTIPNLPVIQEDIQPNHEIQTLQPPVLPAIQDQQQRAGASTQAGITVPLRVMPPSLQSSSSVDETQVVIGQDQGIEEPQSLTKVVEPNTASIS